MRLRSHRPARRWVLCAGLEAVSLGGEGHPGAPPGSAPGPEHRPGRGSVGADGFAAESLV